MHYATTLMAPGYRFHSIQNVKFAAPLLPDNTVTLILTGTLPVRCSASVTSAMRAVNAIPPAAGRFAYVVTFRPCVLIPCYNHGAMMAAVLARLAPFDLPCPVVDDGSEEHAPHRRT